MLHAFFVRLFLCFSHLLLFLLYPPPFFFPLVGTSSPSESLPPSHPAISSSTGSLRNSWAVTPTRSRKRRPRWSIVCAGHSAVAARRSSSSTTRHITATTAAASPRWRRR